MARNIFNTVRANQPDSNYFDLSHDVKLSFNMGELIPITVLDVIPGDKFKIRAEAMVRFAPLIAPVMHKVTVSMHYFFVPNRLVWSNWEKFITDNNGNDPVPAPPVIPAGDYSNAVWGPGSLSDYLGLPVRTDTLTRFPTVSALPFAAYQCIYNEYYRDQNLEPEVNYQLVDGSNTNITELSTKRIRAWMHDYFTAALPWAQKGDAVSVPIANVGEIPVKLNYPSGLDQTWSSDSAKLISVEEQSTTNPDIQSGELYADGTDTGTSTLINDLRTAFKLQEWLEKMARGGSRYIEQIRMMFGVKSSDARLQRPEYIGGSKQPVIISEVLQTSESQTTPQATMAGHALSANSGNSFNYYAEEHGYIIGIASIMPNTAYQQGIPRHFSRETHLDYAWPTFAHLGEQEIKNKELYYDATVDDDETFGYIPRYSEYRYVPSRVAGEFRDSLAFWHISRIFENRPQLNADFIKATSGTSGGIRNDIFAVTDPASQKMWCHVYNNISARRKLPKYGTPTL